jgi:hypothetical protein
MACGPVSGGRARRPQKGPPRTERHGPEATWTWAGCHFVVTADRGDHLHSVTRLVRSTSSARPPHGRPSLASPVGRERPGAGRRVPAPLLGRCRSRAGNGSSRDRVRRSVRARPTAPRAADAQVPVGGDPRRWHDTDDRGDVGHGVVLLRSWPACGDSPAAYPREPARCSSTPGETSSNVKKNTVGRFAETPRIAETPRVSGCSPCCGVLARPIQRVA